MSDNGVLPDTTAGDGSYTVQVNISNIACLLVGNYNIQYIAKNNGELFSNVINSTLPVANTNNQSPTVSGLIAPDSIVVPSSGENVEVLSVFVTDPDGLCDINSVYFSSFKPNGSPSSGNPFAMFDDGNIPLHGDTVANDGRYSLKIAINSGQTTFGPFKFVYEAIDNSSALSNQIIDTINVVQP
jgi:hypothetical protein